ncbi:MAG: phenylalanine--tRNA ligase subunit alpha [Planctomycetota bacterium]|nr:phenylalanine--tRNA ligase subunit alpha [Planctomycetota bacterium]
MSRLDHVETLRREALRQISAAADSQALEALRIEWLGRKSGQVTALLRSIPTVPAEERGAFGQAVNALKTEVTARLAERKAALVAPAKARPAVDVTMPGRQPALGRVHPITRAAREMIEIFGRLGFEVVEGPEVEDEWHNFVALNIPPEHPARDPLDNYYLDDRLLLRTQTSTVQIRVMENRPPPVRIIAPGRVYRPETVDAGHSNMFHQLEGLWVEQGVTFADLKGVLSMFARAFFGPDVRTRFLPSYFPFTEPSAELYVSCLLCAGKGCPACKRTGWMEIGGCGMVDPNVFEAVGYDAEEVTGFAFGFGIERPAMLKYGITDIRLLFENDLRFLRQF